MEVPNSYYISKGNYDPNIMESRKAFEPINLECYEYIINKDEDGFGYYAVCDELHAVTQAKTWKKLKDNILEVHSLMLDYDN